MYGYLPYIIPPTATTAATCYKGFNCPITVHGQGLSGGTEPKDRAWLFALTLGSPSSQSLFGNTFQGYAISDPCGGQAVTAASEYSFFNASDTGSDKNAEKFDISVTDLNAVPVGTYMLCWISGHNFNATAPQSRNATIFKQAAMIVTVASYGPRGYPQGGAGSLANVNRTQCFINTACKIGFFASFDPSGTGLVATSAGTTTTNAKLVSFGNTLPALSGGATDLCSNGSPVYITVGGATEVPFTAVDTDLKMWQTELPAGVTIAAITNTAGADHAYVGICIKSAASAWTLLAGYVHVFSKAYRPYGHSTATSWGTINLPAVMFHGIDIQQASFGNQLARPSAGPPVTVCPIAQLTCTITVPVGYSGSSAPFVYIYDYNTGAKLDCGATGNLETATTSGTVVSTGAKNAGAADAVGMTTISMTSGILTVTLDTTKYSQGRDYRLCVGLNSGAAPSTYPDFVLAEYIVFTGVTESSTTLTYGRSQTPINDLAPANTKGSVFNDAATRTVINSDTIVLKSGSSSCLSGTYVTNSFVPSLNQANSVQGTSSTAAFSISSLITNVGANLIAGTTYQICYQERMPYGAVPTPPTNMPSAGGHFLRVGQLVYYPTPNDVTTTYAVPTDSGWTWAANLPPSQFNCYNSTSCTVKVRGYTRTLSSRSGSASFAVAKLLKADTTLIGSCVTADLVGTPFEITTTNDATNLVTDANLETLTLVIPAAVTALFEPGSWKYQLCFLQGATAAAGYTAGLAQRLAVIHVPNNSTCTAIDFLTSPSGYASPVPTALKTTVTTFITGAANTGYLKGVKVKSTPGGGTTAASGAESMKASLSVLLAAVAALYVL